MLSIRNLTVRPAGGGEPFVRNISLDVPAGSLVTLVGESGSGKSLTASSVMRLLPSTLETAPASEILFDGVEITSLPEKRVRALRGKEIGMIFQEPMSALNPLHTVSRQVAEAIKIHDKRISAAEVKTRVEKLFDDVRLSEALAGREQVYPHELSGGQRQRVMIAAALANNPKLLIADEPTTALDVTTQAAVLDLLDALRKERGAGLLMITHDLKLAARYADYCYVMNTGEIVEHGPAAELLSAPSHPYTKLLLESREIRPRAPRDRRKTAALPSVIEAKDLQAGYERRGFLRSDTMYVLKNTSFTLKRGRTLGVVGGSGSGKTTLAMAMLGMIKAKGELRVGNADAAAGTRKEARKLRKIIHIVFQDPFGSLNPRMTVRQILTEGPRAHHMRDKLNDAYVSRLIESVGLESAHLDRYPHAFSGGQRQRIAFARALAMEPEVMILDEPTSALDVVTRKSMLELLRLTQRERDMSYVLISHDMHVVAALSDDILVLKDGLPVEYGSAAEMLRAPKEDYTKQLAEAAAL